MDTRKKVVTTTIEEDFKAIGVPLDEDEQAGLSGILTEDGADPIGEGGEPPKAKTCEKCGKADSTEKCACVKEDIDDAIDGPLVTKELLERVSNLPFENFEEKDFDDLLAELKTKALPEGDEELKTMAEEVVKKILDEKIGTRMRAHKARSMGKKVRFQCGPGFRTNPADPTGKQCVRAAVAAGGKGKLTKEQRKKRLWGRSGKGMHSKKVSARWAARRPRRASPEGLLRPFAAELAALTEGTSEVQESVRDEIMGRVGRIFRLLHEEFLDPSVTEVYENVFEELDEAWEAGRLDEEVMEVEDFIAEVKPALSLIMKSLDRLDRIDNGELEGN
jgi:hypothetical protein